MNEEELYEKEVEAFLKIERERYCQTQCHATKPEDCIFVDIVYVKKKGTL